MAKKGNKSGCEGGVGSTLRDLVTCELPDLIKATTVCVLQRACLVLNMVTRDALIPDGDVTFMADSEICQTGQTKKNKDAPKAIFVKSYAVLIRLKNVWGFIFGDSPQENYKLSTEHK